MKNPKIKIILTEDGSHSLYREDLKETYHSFHGAMGESVHVFIKMGLAYLIERGEKGIKVFEVGFGTGLNAFLALKFAEEHQVQISFHSVEPIPVQEEIYKELNYADENERSQFMKLHEAAWNEPVEISENFVLSKYETTLEDFDDSAVNGTFDAIFFDAFAPSKQSELWELKNLEKCFGLLRSGGILTTYCAQGQFKRNMEAAGFEVETLKGALRKKEMVRGIRS